MNKVQAAAGAIWTALQGLLAIGTFTVAPVAVPGLPEWAAGAAGVVLAVAVFAAKSLAVAAEARAIADRIRAGVDAVDDAIDAAVPADPIGVTATPPSAGSPVPPPTTLHAG